MGKNLNLNEKGKLKLISKIGFGIGDLGGNLFVTVIGFYLLYYLTDIVRIPSALAGTALMIGKIWDAITDPLVGYLSDNTKSRWGRRKPYLFIGSILLLLGMIIMFAKPGIVNKNLLFIYIVIIYCFLNTAYTLVNIPYGALTPELTKDYHERTELNGYRMSFAVIGTMVGAALTLPIVNSFDNKVTGWIVAGAVMGFIMFFTMIITIITVHENNNYKKEIKIPILKSYKEVLKLKAFLTALFPWTFHIMGITIIQSGLLYYFKYIIHNESLFQIALMILLLTSILFIPVWVKISKKIGKKLSYNIGMFIVTVFAIVFSFGTKKFGPTFGYIIMFLTGIGFATQYVMPYSIIPDIIEYDYSINKVRREGVFYGMWTFSSKVGQAFALFLSGWILSIFGYIPEVEQTALSKLGITLLIGIFPAILFLIGISILFYYPIDKKFYNKIIKDIEEFEKDN